MQNIPMLPVQKAEVRGIVDPKGEGASVQLRLIEMLPPTPIHPGNNQQHILVPREFHFSIPLDIALTLSTEMLKSAITTQIAKEVINGRFGNIALPHYPNGDHDVDSPVANARGEIEENLGNPSDGGELPASGPERSEPPREIQP